MKTLSLRTTAALLGLFCAVASYAQQSQSTSTTTVPKLVRFSGSFHPVSGQPAQPVESVTLSVYSDQTGGTALWQETQNVAVDAEGHYSVLMGATQNDGVPMELLNAGEPRWVGAQFNRPGEAEQSRVLMTSVPYALKSVDADTLGGKPASAYLLAPSGTNATSSAVPAGSATAPATSTTVPNTVGTTTTNAVTPRITPGVAGFIPVFNSASNLVDSVMQQAGGSVGIGTVPGANASTLTSLDLRTFPYSQIGMAQTVDYMSFFSSDFFGPAIYWNPGKDMRFGKGGVGLYNAGGFVEQMRIQSATGNVGIGTSNPGSTLDVAGNINLTGVLRYQTSPVLQIPGAVANGNLGVGVSALASNTTGDGNTALGYQALAGNQGGGANTAFGTNALVSNVSGVSNTANGDAALFTNNGNYNSAVGNQALYLNSGGSSNVAIGYQAGYNITGSNNVDIGNAGNAGESGIIRIGTFGTQTKFFAAGANFNLGVDANAVGLMVDTTTGQLGVMSSSQRYKEDIEDMGDTSRGLMDLRPVTFRYKQPSADGSQPIQYGLIAEEVAEVYPDLVAHTADGQIETVKYQVLDSMLLNEVQRQQAEIHGLEQQNRSLQERLEKLETALTSIAGASVSGASKAPNVP